MGMRPSTDSTTLRVLVILGIFAVPAFGQQMHRLLYNALPAVRCGGAKASHCRWSGHEMAAFG